MSKKFIPKSGEEYFAIETQINGQPAWCTGEFATSEKDLRRNDEDRWKWTYDIFSAKAFETKSAAEECNFDFCICGYVTGHINYDGKSKI